MKSLKRNVYICAIVVNALPLLIHRLAIGKLLGDEKLIYAMFFIAIIISSLLYLPVLKNNKIKVLRRFLFLPSALYFILGTLGIITQIKEDGEFYISMLFYSYAYFVVNIIYAHVIYKYYIILRYIP